MAGQTHELITAMVVIEGDQIFRHTDVTRLRMRPLSPAAIERYVAADQPLDCAGAYKLESAGSRSSRRSSRTITRRSPACRSWPW